MPFYKTTYYQVLGLQPSASSNEIKQAYRKLAKSYHPDTEIHTKAEKTLAHQKMTRLNEAYEILKDKSKRTAYDYSIGVAGRDSRFIGGQAVENEEIRQHYLQGTFYPARQSILRILGKYKKQLSDLSEDIFDEKRVDKFAKYTNEIEETLSHASQALNKKSAPPSLSGAELMLKHSIARACDGLEELRYFCSNYDYNHLAIAGTLFRESNNLSRQAQSLSKS